MISLNIETVNKCIDLIILGATKIRTRTLTQYIKSGPGDRHTRIQYIKSETLQGMKQITYLTKQNPTNS